MPLQQPPYLYQAEVAKVVDGDTVDLIVDCGFRVTIRDRFRLFGINTPEMKGDTHNAGLQSRFALLSMIPVGSKVLVKSHKGQDKYGRWLVEIQAPGVDGTVNDRMVREKWAVEYLP